MRAYQPIISKVQDDPVNAAIATFTRPLPNGDGTQSSVHEDFIRFMMEGREGRRGGGAPAKANSIRYSVLAILVAIYILILEKSPITHAGVKDLLLHRMTDDHRDALGMTVKLAGTRAVDDRRGRTSKDAKVKARGKAAHEAESDRVAKLMREILDVIDPSPFYKDDVLTGAERASAKKAQAEASKTGKPNRKERAAGVSIKGQVRRVGPKMTNRLRDAILANENHPDRRIDNKTMQRNQDRLLDVMNKIVAAAADDGFPTHYQHDIAVDETICITLKPRPGHGTRDEQCLSADPDASYWPGKRENDDERGFGYGFEILWRAARPYSRAVPIIPIGIGIGRISGGDIGLIRRIHERAVRFGLITPDAKDRGYLIADMGYSPKDEFLPFTLTEGYSPIFQMPENWNDNIALGDVNARGNPIAGARIHSGAICCPAIGDISPLTPGPRDKTTETDKDIQNRARATRLIDLHIMPVRNQLSPYGRANIQALRDGGIPDEYKITVQCPAAAGKVECPARRLVTGKRRDPSKPEVTYPHDVSDPAELPSVCRQNHTTHKLKATEAKRLQPLLYQSYHWEDYFRTIRSANERGNNLLTNANVVGASGEWTQQRGIAKQGFFWAVALAQASLRIASDFESNNLNADGTLKFAPREAERRRRQGIINPKIKGKRSA